jgi:hypothetical protein
VFLSGSSIWSLSSHCACSDGPCLVRLVPPGLGTVALVLVSSVGYVRVYPKAPLWRVFGRFGCRQETAPILSLDFE